MAEITDLARHIAHELITDSSWIDPKYKELEGDLAIGIQHRIDTYLEENPGVSVYLRDSDVHKMD